MRLLRDEPQALSALIARTSEKIGFPQAFIEKDYWLTEVLRSLVKPFEVPVTVVLKGGTSLSKVYQIIDRMSEDVDVLLAFPEGASPGSRDRALKALVARVSDDLGIPPTLVASTTGIKRNVRFLYAGAQDARVSEGVLLEMGIRGGINPNESRRLRSYVAEVAISSGLVSSDEYAEMEPVVVRVLDPVRTLVEKVAAVHAAASRLPDSAGAARLSVCARHYYDINRLLENKKILAVLERVDVRALAADIDAASEAAGYDYSERPVAGYATSPAFSGSDETRGILEQPYADVLGLVIPGRAMPTFDDCLVSVRSANRLL